MWEGSSKEGAVNVLEFGLKNNNNIAHHRLVKSEM
jgi:hypothetical protein